MNLRPIFHATQRPFRCSCIRCGKLIKSDRDSDARADLDGKPFAAYYCGPCVAELGEPAASAWNPPPPNADGTPTIGCYGAVPTMSSFGRVYAITKDHRGETMVSFQYIGERYRGDSRIGRPRPCPDPSCANHEPRDTPGPGSAECPICTRTVEARYFVVWSERSVNYMRQQGMIVDEVKPCA